MKYLILLLALTQPAQAASYEILHPDNEVKKFMFTKAIAQKKLGAWECLFRSERPSGSNTDYLTVSCNTGNRSAETISFCLPGQAAGTVAIVKLFDNKKRWSIDLKCE